MTNINWQPTHLQNELVKLIPLTETDFERVYAIASDPAIWEQHPESNRYQRDVFQTFLDSALKSQTAFIIVDQQTKTCIGSTRFYQYNPEESSIAIGYTFLAKAYWGGLYNKACKRLLMDYAFQYVNKIFFHIGADNIRSQLGTTRLGAIKTREYLTDRNGQPAPTIEYVIHKTD
jgi:RimJ/RimL family protein N-acetyltransferase